MRSVVVTGVSTGIGRATAATLLGRGWRVFGSVRRAAEGAALKTEWGDAFEPLLFDVTDEAAIAAAAAEVRAALGGRVLDGLVNNAGIALADPLLVQSVADFRRQIEVNLIGPFAVTRAFAPLLGVDPGLSGPKGRIVNVSSVGGRIGVPFLGAYAASKHGIEGLSESLRRELVGLGIDVVVVGPGAVATPIWDKAEEQPQAHLAGTPWAEPARRFARHMIDEGRKGLAPEAIGAVIAQALEAPRPKTRYAVLRGKFVNETIPRLLPKRLVDRVLGRRIGLLA